MKFSELEQKMSQIGVDSLAEIARKLQTTPQAVSNWKARDQVPYHIVAKVLNKSQNIESGSTKSQIIQEDNNYAQAINFTDIFVTIAEQIKIIVLISFISIFITLTYVQFMVEPIYISTAKILLPEDKVSSMGNLAGLASQFGVNVPSGNNIDLSNPTLYPELIKSNTFAENIMDKQFYLTKYNKKLPLLNILTHGTKPNSESKESLLKKATSKLNSEILYFYNDPMSPFSVLNVSTNEPLFSKELADLVLIELDQLNRQFKRKSVDEKTLFINNRITSVKKDLSISEIRLKEFNEKNRQISSPALELEQDRLQRDLEVQKDIYLTLKQQLELAKIEEIEQVSVVQVLDYPKIPLVRSNNNKVLALLSAGIIGIIIGIGLGLLRSFFSYADIDERKKFRKIKFFLAKKGKEIFNDTRFSGTISVFLLFSLPIYFLSKSDNPVYFDRYSQIHMLINLFIVLAFLLSSFIYMHARKKTKNTKKI